MEPRNHFKNRAKLKSHKSRDKFKIMDRIIIMGNEPELLLLASIINKTYCNGKADIVMYNDDNIGQKTKSDNLFLVGHASNKVMGQYDFHDLKIHFRDHLNGASSIYLSGCSTKDEAALVLNDKGFIPMTLAKNVKKYTGKRVFGTPGALVSYGDKLYVEVRVNSGYKASDIFVEA